MTNSSSPTNGSSGPSGSDQIDAAMANFQQQSAQDIADEEQFSALQGQISLANTEAKANPSQ